MDYSRLRAAALKDGGNEEAVTVDTRALIDKVLARYSGEWTTLRELIQNAADAQATTVQVKWETLPSTQVPLPQTTDRSELLKHIINNHTLRRLVVQNNGQPFTATDWGRLKRIAEGNPDETKIGAFGVGFYSVFADCEEPFVSSGGEAMAFYWKGNALFTRKLQLPPEQKSGDTAFVLDYRNTTTPLPGLLSVSQFLATSLTFVALQNIEFWIDDYRVLSLQKKTSPSIDIPIPRDLETRTAEGLMKLASVGRTSAQIDANFMRAVGWKSQRAAAPGNKSDDASSFGTAAPEMPSLKNFFSRFTSGGSGGAKAKAAKEEKAAQEVISENVTVTSSCSIFLRITSASIATHVSASFATELERATKKPPPSTTKLAILTSSYDETVASEESTKTNKIATNFDIFATVLPSKQPGGRVFIGFPTTQTTGGGMHISAPSVIPTVEREAIDLNARWVRTWNFEMLRIAGILARLAFANDMSDLNHKLLRAWEAAGKKTTLIPRPIIEQFLPEALHILKTYTFQNSTPSGQVSQLMEEAFWTAYKRATIEVYSSQGVLMTGKVRIGSEELSNFVDGIPVILESMKETPFIKKLTDFGLVGDITPDDVHRELEGKALDKTQLHHFIFWLSRLTETREIDHLTKKRLLNGAVATISEDGSQGDVIALGTIKNFIVPADINPALPVPQTTLPFALTTSINVKQLENLGWEPLKVVSWLRYIIESGPSRPDDTNPSKSPKFAVQVLSVLSKTWDNVNQGSKNSIINLLKNVTIMPTKLGMRKPEESFFPYVKLFDDLPVIENCHTLKEKFLLALGVRKTVDLETIFSRLLNTSPKAGASARGSHMELIKYLASVQDDIPAADLRKLRETPLCPAEAGPLGMEPTKGTTELYRVSALFEPKDTLRNLKLPILQWPGPPGSFRENSKESRFLYVLGLRKNPSGSELVTMMAGPDVALRANAMAYFIGNHQANGYASFDLSKSSKAFLPIEGTEKKLVSPQDCFTNETCSVLGYNILRNDLHPHAFKLGVQRDPPISACVDTLISRPPVSHEMAVKWFGYFTGRMAAITDHHVKKLKDAPIVPVVSRQVRFSGSTPQASGTSRIYMSPSQCYLGSSEVYGKIFDFVDFGSIANAFLLKCGAKLEPTKTEIAEFAVGEPARLLSILSSPDKYLDLLRSLAGDLANLKRNKALFSKMKLAPFLLGWKEVSATKPEKSDPVDDDDDTAIKQYQLVSPDKVVVIDDYISYRLFRDTLICAPEDDALENFYIALGSKTLGSMVEEDVKIGPYMRRDADAAARLRKHVIERSKIFLYEYSRYKPESIQHDAKWLEANMRLELVQSVALRRSLRGTGKHHTERRSAASSYVKQTWTLYVAADGRPDMYQVGQAVCQLLLKRPNQQAYLFFEPLLQLDLLHLRARGYNVDRILRVKQAEARLADEERRNALAAEEKKRKMMLEQQQNPRTPTNDEKGKAKAAEAAREAVKTPPTPTRMPGSFGDSPEEDSDLPSPKHRGPREFFSYLSRRLGFDDNDRKLDQQQLQNEWTPKPQGPPPSRGKDDGRVTSPAVVQQNLLNAIKSSRAHNSSKLFSPPKENTVKEQSTYCDSSSEHNLELMGEAPRGMKVFVDKFLTTSKEAVIPSNRVELWQFERLLKEAGIIYGMATASIHIFFDEKGSTIAFNKKGSIFCNLRFFKQLHTWKSEDPQAERKRVEALTWWWVVLAHELAHNLVSTHNSDHSYYTESFIQQYFHKMVAKVMTPDPMASTSRPNTAQVNNGGKDDNDKEGEGSGSQAPPPSYETTLTPPGYQSLLD